MNESQKLLPYVPVFIKLLKGPVEYVDKSIWEKLLQYKSELTMFLTPLGLSLVLDEQDGYAYLKHLQIDEEENAVSWIPRRALTYEESIMLVLLREMMAEFEVGAATTRELIRKRREIKEYAELFFKENASRVKFLKEIDRLIDRTAENGFLDTIEHNEIADEQKFRIKKIIKARVGSDELEAFLGQLTNFKRKVADGDGVAEDGAPWPASGRGMQVKEVATFTVAEGEVIVGEAMLTAALEDAILAKEVAAAQVSLNTLLQENFGTAEGDEIEDFQKIIARDVNVAVSKSEEEERTSVDMEAGTSGAPGYDEDELSARMDSETEG